MAKGGASGRRRLPTRRAELDNPRVLPTEGHRRATFSTPHDRRVYSTGRKLRPACPTILTAVPSGRDRRSGHGLSTAGHHDLRRGHDLFAAGGSEGSVRIQDGLAIAPGDRTAIANECCSRRRLGLRTVSRRYGRHCLAVLDEAGCCGERCRARGLVGALAECRFSRLEPRGRGRRAQRPSMLGGSRHA